MPKRTGSLDISAYNVLRKKVEATLIRGQEIIERQKVKTYWETGRLIHAFILKGKNRADYGKQVIEHLADDLQISTSLLWRTLRFHEKYPILATWPESSKKPRLSWSHYRQLMTIPDNQTRETLTQRAEKNEWTVTELGSKIKTEIYPDEPSDSSSLVTHYSPLTPKRGTLYTYRLLQPEQINSGKPYVLIDLGFAVYRRLYTPGLKAGTLIESVWDETKEDYQILKSGRSESELFTYKAMIEYVVDGDTLRVKVDLGFDNWTRQYLRLRGINAPELGTPEGKKTLAFVKNCLKNVPFITLQSSRSDKYDRYLADVFYKDKNGNEVFLNNELLSNGLAVRM